MREGGNQERKRGVQESTQLQIREKLGKRIRRNSEGGGHQMKAGGGTQGWSLSRGKTFRAMG